MYLEAASRLKDFELSAMLLTDSTMYSMVYGWYIYLYTK